MNKKYRLSGKNKKVFLDGLMQYHSKGIAILIDGEETEPSQWEKILEIYADGSFYMGDYIFQDEISPQNENNLQNQTLFDKVCEKQEEYQTEKSKAQKKLVEIRFDRVYHY